MEIEEHFFTLAAEADFQVHYGRYGDAFYATVDRTVEQLRKFPESGPLYDDPVRRILIRDTPPGLFYGIHGRRLAIVAILDLRQDPESIARRIADGS